MSLKQKVRHYQKEGFILERAKVKACQDTLMSKLVLSKYKEKLTFKGGTIMYHLTKEKRRATKDIDIDLINTSISKKSLITIFNDIGQIDDDTNIYFKIKEQSIKELSHDTYKGKTANLIFEDEKGYNLNIKIDIGIHNYIDVKQEIIVFEILPSKNKIQILCNPVEQIIVEKTTSFIKRGILSTRIKDLYDIYYLLTYCLVDKRKLIKYTEEIIINKNLSKSMDKYVCDFIDVINQDVVLNKMEISYNWLNVSNKDVIKEITSKFKNIFEVI